MNGKTLLEEQIERIHEACGTANLTELSVFLRAGMMEFAEAREQGRVPENWLLFLLQSKNLNPEWVLSGCGPRHIGGSPVAGMKAYIDGQTARERMERLEALRSFSARELTDELLRRLAGQSA